VTPPSIHNALDEIVALHAVLVCGAIGIVRKARFAERVRLELPIVLQPQSDVVANRPVIRFPVDEAGAGLSLGMALDAGVGRSERIGLRRVENVRARGLCGVDAARRNAFKDEQRDRRDHAFASKVMSEKRAHPLRSNEKIIADVAEAEGVSFETIYRAWVTWQSFFEEPDET
jgi:hypothetical protein